MCLSTVKKKKDRTKWGLLPRTVRFSYAFFSGQEVCIYAFGKEKEKDRTKWGRHHALSESPTRMGAGELASYVM